MIAGLYRLLGVLLLVGSLGGGWLLLQYQHFVETPLQIPGDGVVLQVTPGMSLVAVADQLQQRQLLPDGRWLRLLARLEPQQALIQAGEYRLLPGITPPKLLELLRSGEVVQHTLTVVEGWSFARMRAVIAAERRLHHTLADADDAAVMAAVGHAGEHPEGRFFPDTYHFPRGLNDVAFFQRAYDAMAQQLATAWQQRAADLPLKSPYEALILASIIEKESGLASERPQIAGVFVRRLQRRMRLQTDPTVIYGLGALFDGNLTRRHLRTDNPYNTYRIMGLPPTPIALPGADALHAALHPAAGSALYFVARGDGSHHFSATLEEHNRAVRRYQLRR